MATITSAKHEQGDAGDDLAHAELVDVGRRRRPGVAGGERQPADRHGHRGDEDGDPADRRDEGRGRSSLAQVLGREGVSAVPRRNAAGRGLRDLWTNHGPGL